MSKLIKTERGTISEFTDKEHRIYKEAINYFTKASKLVTNKKSIQKRVDGVKYVDKEVEDWDYTFENGVKVYYDYQYDKEPGFKGTDSILKVVFPNEETFTYIEWMSSTYTFQLLED